MTTDDLLAQILANPRPTSLRLVYADALIERGDPRGEFIVLAAAPGTRSEERRARLAQYLAAYTRAWKDRQLDVVFDRGFVRKVRGSAAAIVAAGDALAREPVEELQVAPLDGLAALLALPALRRATTLYLDRSLGDANARLLAHAELPALRSLGVFPGPLARASAEALGRAPWVRQLQQLAVANGSERIHVEMFAEANALAALAIDSCPLADEARDIAARCPQLQSLTCFANRMGDDGVRGLAVTPLARLANLALRYQDLRAPGFRAVAEATAWPALRRLALDGNRAGDDAIIALADTRADLVELDLGNNLLTARGVRALVASPRLANLAFLNLRGNPPSDDLAHALAAGLPALERLGMIGLTPAQRATILAHRPSLQII